MSTTTVVTLGIVSLVVVGMLFLYKTKRITGRAATILFVVGMSIKGIFTTVLLGGGLWTAWQNMNTPEEQPPSFARHRTLDEIMRDADRELDAKMRELDNIR